MFGGHNHTRSASLHSKTEQITLSRGGVVSQLGRGVFTPPFSRGKVNISLNTIPDINFYTMKIFIASFLRNFDVKGRCDKNVKVTLKMWKIQFTDLRSILIQLNYIQKWNFCLLWLCDFIKSFDSFYISMSRTELRWRGLRPVKSIESLETGFVSNRLKKII